MYLSIREQNALEESFHDGFSDEEISEALIEKGFAARTARGIKRQRYRLKLLIQPSTRPKKPYSSPADLAFKMAMLRAIKAGNETATLGVVKDRRPVAISAAMRPETFVATRSALAD